MYIITLGPRLQRLWLERTLDYTTRRFDSNIESSAAMRSAVASSSFIGISKVPVLKALGPVYTKRQRQRCNDACDTALIGINGNK